MEGDRMQRFAFVFLFLLFPLSGFAQTGSLEERLTGLVDKVKPSIVKIKSEAGSREEGKVSTLRSTLALGIAIDPQHIVTTADIEQLKFFSIISTPESVLLSDDSKGNLRFTVQTSDGRQLEARLVATDKISNLAILKVEEGNLTPAPFGNAEELKTGALVIVPASCLSKSSSASFGPVAELRRDGSLLLDVSVFPGTVGSPVLNQHGEVVGMVTGQTGQAMALRTIRIEKDNDIQKTSQPVDLPVSGQAVALPASQLQKLASQMIQYQKVARPFMGVYPQNLDEDLKAYYKVEYGVLITDMADGGPAEIAGLKEGDVILSLGGQKMENENQFRQFLGEKKPGDIVKIEVLRNNRKRTLKLTLGDRSDFEPAAPMPPPVPRFRTPDVPKSLTPAYPAEGFLGVSIADLTEEQKERYNLDAGAYVEEITEGTPAGKAGLKEGDVITAFDGKPVADGDDLYQKIRKSESGKEVPIEILRRGERKTLNVTLADRPGYAPNFRGNFPGQERMQIFRFGDRAGFLGVSTEPLSRPVKDSLKIDGGVRVANVTPDSPAEKAGLKQGDVLVAVDGQKVFTPEDLSEIIGKKESGNEVKIEYLRKGAQRTAQAELTSRSGRERFLGGAPRMDFRTMPGFDARDRQIDKLEKRIEELRRSLDSLRREKE